MELARRMWRRIAGWGGGALAVMVVVWLGSCFWYVGWMVDARYSVAYQSGGVWIDRSGTSELPLPPGWYSGRVGSEIVWQPKYRVRAGVSGRAAGSASGNAGANAGGWYVFVPLWIPTAAVGAVNVWAWGMIALERWRMRMRGRCWRCRYDRTGLAKGAACPECGAMEGGEG